MYKSLNCQICILAFFLFYNNFNYIISHCQNYSMSSPPRQAKVHRVLLACRCLQHLINQKGLRNFKTQSLMFKALLYCNYTSTNIQLYSQSGVIYLARYHTTIPVFHIFNFLSAKNAAKPAPQFYSMKYCSVKRKSPPALRPTALASFPYFQFFPLFFQKIFPLFWRLSKPAYLLSGTGLQQSNICRSDFLIYFLFAPYCQLFTNH